LPFFLRRPMASEIFGTAALFWVLIPVGLVGGGLLLRLLRD
jgi:cytochrome b6-f complex subunit 7